MFDFVGGPGAPQQTPTVSGQRGHEGTQGEQIYYRGGGTVLQASGRQALRQASSSIPARPSRLSADGQSPLGAHSPGAVSARLAEDRAEDAWYSSLARHMEEHGYSMTDPGLLREPVSKKARCIAMRAKLMLVWSQTDTGADPGPSPATEPSPWTSPTAHSQRPVPAPSEAPFPQFGAPAPPVPDAKALLEALRLLPGGPIDADSACIKEALAYLSSHVD
jgi:hypothetical protein